MTDITNINSVLVSFLGVIPYRRFRYSFKDVHNEVIEANYAATAAVSYLRKKGIHVSRLVIAGTSASIWCRLSEYISDKAEDMFGSTDECRAAVSALCSDEISEINRRISECSAEGSEISKLLIRLENCFNDALQSVDMQVSLILHPENFSVYRNQIMLIDRFRSLDFMDSSSEIYLDITNGLRIMPFAVFADFQCLCRINGFRIEKILYLPEYMPPTEPVERLSAIEECRSALRFLKYSDPEAYGQKLEEIKNLIGIFTKRAKCKNPANDIPESRVCFLDVTEKILKHASLIDEFQVSADPSVFTRTFEISKFSVWVKNCRNLREISFLLGMGQFQKAAELISLNHSEIERNIGCSDISQLLHRFFSWSESFISSKSKREKAEALKKLAGFYLDRKNFAQAIITAYSAVYNYEFPVSAYGNKENNQKYAVLKRYKSAKDFIDYRGMLVHLADKTVAINSPCKLAQALEKKNGLMDLSLLPEMISKSIEGLGVKVKTNDEAARRVLITFIGSGDYGCCDYTYVNPFHSDDHSFDVNGSGMVGISLARKLKEDPREDLSLLVVCGTYSSNWRMVMLAFEREFGEKLPEEIVSEFGGLKSLVIERQNKNSSLAGDDIEKLTGFFEKIGSYTGFDVKLVFISPEISELSVQQSLMDSLTRLLRFGDELSFDITHSYRIIPILTLCYSQYFGALLNTKIRHIFYGDIQQEQDLNFLNGLKYSQLKDEAVFKTIMFEIRNRVLQGINGRSAVSGIVYEMKNIANLMRYSSAISQFRATGNLMFLLSMMKIELKKRRPELYRSFINGALLKNFMLITGSCSYLKPVLEELKRGIKDPVMSFLSREITENLSSLPYDADDRTAAGVASRIRYYASQAKMHLDLENIFMSLLFCYEGMHYAGDILWRAGRASMSKKSITAGADGKLIFKCKINSAVEKMFNLALENKSAKDITGFFNEEKKKGGAHLAAACFGRDIWKSIKNGRNSIFHLDYAGFSDVDEATEIVKIAVNEITRRSEILDGNIKG